MFFKEKFFDELRTKQQLGYIVFLRDLYYNNNYYICYAVQSSEYDINHIKNSIEKFIKESENTINDERNFKQLELYKKSLYDKFNEPDLNIFELHHRNLNQILKQKYDYNYLDRLKKEIGKIQLRDLYDFHKEYINKNSFNITINK